MKLLTIFSFFLTALTAAGSAQARQFRCFVSDSTGSITTTFDSTKPLFEVKALLPGGLQGDELILTPTKTCLQDTSTLPCQSAERMDSGTYYYSYTCGSRAQFNLSLDAGGSGQATCDTSDGGRDLRVFMGCH